MNNANPVDPKRIRSKIVLAVYKTTFNLHTDTVLNIFREVCRIESEQDWKYIMKSEKSSNGENMIQLYLELKRSPDFYLRKVCIKIQDGIIISPTIWCLRETSFALFFLLKEYDISTVQNYLKTNISLDELRSYIINSHSVPLHP